MGHACDLFDLEIWESGNIERLFSMHAMQANTTSSLIVCSVQLEIV